MIETTEREPKNRKDFEMGTVYEKEKKWTNRELLDSIWNSTIETNWIVRAIAKKLELDPDKVIEDAAK